MSIFIDYTSEETRKKLIIAELNFDALLEAYLEGQMKGLLNLFAEHSIVMKSDKIVKRISEFFEDLFELIR